jgi:hypothetical protein
VFDFIGGSKQAIKYDKMLEKICGYIGNVFEDSNKLVGMFLRTTMSWWDASKMT